jgi:DNA polymerase III alpha subunit
MRELLTELNDRVLRFDGVSIVEPDQVEALLRRGAIPSQLRVVYETPEIEAFNRQVSLAERLMEFEPEPLSFKFTWQLPPEFLSLDVEEHVSVVFGERLPALGYDSAQTETAITRVAQELGEFKRRGLDDLLRTIIYVLHRFKETNQVWGVGRGSSCASFILFLLGLHVVDPIKFDVPLEEFMHD